MFLALIRTCGYAEMISCHIYVSGTSLRDNTRSCAGQPPECRNTRTVFNEAITTFKVCITMIKMCITMTEVCITVIKEGITLLL